MKIYYYTNRDKLQDTHIPDYLESKGHVVLVDFIRPEIDWLTENNIEFIISDRARFLIRKEVIDSMPGRIINLHPSFLPWCKGYHPILAGIVKNQCLGVTIHQIDVGIDTGKTLLQQPILVEPSDTLSTLYDKHRIALVDLLKTNLNDLLFQKVRPMQQHTLLGSFHLKDQFPEIIKSLPNGWNTSVEWIRENIDNLGDVT